MQGLAKEATVDTGYKVISWSKYAQCIRYLVYLIVKYSMHFGSTFLEVEHAEVAAEEEDERRCGGGGVGVCGRAVGTWAHGSRWQQRASTIVLYLQPSSQEHALLHERADTI